jgi:hypothetical protein
VAIVDNQHAQQLCDEFKNYYNAERSQQGISGNIPNLSIVQVDVDPDLDDLRVEKRYSLNGLVTTFKLVA